MAKKNDGLTPRQRQSQQIMRDKAALKKRKALLQKTTLIGGAILAVTVLGGSVWAYKSGAFARTQAALSGSIYGVTASAGFSLQALYLEGRSRTSMEDIEKALDVKRGDPILRVSVGELRERLEKIESVKQAAVERSLPDTLHVRIIEREPVALWQNDGKIALVDDNGIVMNGLDLTPYRNLPLILGDDAPKHVAELMTILASEPTLTKRFAAATHIGERRWNIRLNGHDGAIDVKLPEDKAAEAWKQLADLEEKQQVLERDIKVIDLRLEGRMFLKLVPDMTTGKAANARDT